MSFLRDNVQYITLYWFWVCFSDLKIIVVQFNHKTCNKSIDTEITFLCFNKFRLTETNEDSRGSSGRPFDRVWSR
jgi:hypothetical protein